MKLVSAVASSIPTNSSVTGTNPGSASGSTYIRSQYNLNPPPPLGHGSLPPMSPDDLPPPGYAPSDAPSTIEDASVAWGANTTASSIDGGSQVMCVGGGSQLGLGGGLAVAPPSLPPTYLSSAMSTSSADSSSGGSRQSSSNQSSSVHNHNLNHMLNHHSNSQSSGTSGSLKSFSNQPKNPGTYLSIHHLKL